MPTARASSSRLVPLAACGAVGLSLLLSSLPAHADAPDAAPPPGARLTLDLPLPEPVHAWQHSVDKDGVTVHVREIPGSSIREVHGQGRVEAPPQLVLAVLRDVAAYPGIMPPTETAQLLKRSDEAMWFYMVINPSFITRRDYCIRVRQTALSSGQLQSEWATDPAECPAPRPGLIRLSENRGRWLLSPLDGGRATQVSYLAHTEVGGNVPNWIVNRATPRAVPDVFRALRKAVALPQYQSAASAH